MKTITRDEYYTALALLQLAREADKETLKFVKSLARTLRESTDYDDYYGHVSDAVFEDYSIDVLLSKLEIKVLEDKNG